MYFSYDKGSMASLFPLAASEVREVIKMNRNGIKPESLKTEPEPEIPEFITAVGDDSITRFDAPERRRRRKSQPKAEPRRQRGPARDNNRDSAPRDNNAQNAPRENNARENRQDSRGPRRQGGRPQNRRQPKPVENKPNE